MAFLDETGLAELWRIINNWGANSATKALFGLGSNAVPDDMFAFLAKYNMHYWRASVDTSSWREVRTHQVGTVCYADWQINTVRYSDSITINQTNGAITQNTPIKNNNSALQPSSGSVVSLGQVLLGKYVSISSIIDGSERLWYISPDAVLKGTDTGEEGYMGVIVSGAYAITSKYVVEGDSYLVNSSDVNSYPHAGTSDGVFYDYLGVPFENAVTSPKIAVGRYIGSGTYGESNKNSLTFDFVPKLLIVQQAESSPTLGVFVNGTGQFVGYALTGSDTVALTGSFSGNTVSWYCTNGDKRNQLNDTHKHKYIAIG